MMPSVAFVSDEPMIVILSEAKNLFRFSRTNSMTEGMDKPKIREI